jgi:hypothetical protein
MVQQDIVLNEDTPESQLKQIMGMPLQANRAEKLQSNARKNNMQLLESIQMDSKMMEMRF